MTPPIRNPPCPSCEGYNNLEGDAAALAELDKAAGETRAGNPPARSEAAPSRSAESPAKHETASQNSSARDSNGGASRSESSLRSASLPSAAAESRASERSSFVASEARPNVTRPMSLSNAGAQLFSSSSAPREAMASRGSAVLAASASARESAPQQTAVVRERVEARLSGSEPREARGLTGSESGAGSSSVPLNVRGSFANLAGEGIGGNPWLARVRDSAALSTLGSALQSGDVTKLPAGLQGLVNALRGGLSQGTPFGALAQGLQGLSLGAWISALNPVQRQSLERWLLSQSPARLELAATLHGLPNIPLLSAMNLNVPGWTQRLEQSVLNFASLLRADYLAKNKSKELSPEEAMRDKLGIFSRRKSDKKDDGKKLKELFRILLRRVQKKQDAEWESRKEDANTDLAVDASIAS